MDVSTDVFGQYTPDWESLDSRPLPEWYDQAKIGIFLHWGIYSVPSFGSEWFWKYWRGDQSDRYVEFMNDNYRPGFTYQDFGPQFTAEFFHPHQWAKLFEDAGARYVVLTSKHHEGFTLWPSKYSFSWNAMDVGPQRDLVGDLAKAIKENTSLHFGLYHSLFEWFNPLYLSDQANDFLTNDFVVSKTLPELYEIVTELYEPEIIWSDGDGEASDWYWNSTVFIAWLFNESPVKDTVVVNDRWGSNDINCNHGSFYTCADRYNPGVVQPHKWENCMTLDKSSWGYDRTATLSDYLTIEELLTTLIQTISCGGNLLVNTGPTHDGRIDPIMEERLRQMGQWLSLNGEAIYASNPYTCSETHVYATFLSWPKSEKVELGSVTEDVAEGEIVAEPLYHHRD
ncbi:Plasma alpha-L-fucosidase [Armadillidium vulgare]|nr:Plasma alpha-L-fucosidase [Armadillidium vulgare]